MRRFAEGELEPPVGLLLHVETRPGINSPSYFAVSQTISQDAKSSYQTSWWTTAHLPPMFRKLKSSLGRPSQQPNASVTVAPSLPPAQPPPPPFQPVAVPLAAPPQPQAPNVAWYPPAQQFPVALPPGVSCAGPSEWSLSTGSSASDRRQTMS